MSRTLSIIDDSRHAENAYQVVGEITNPTTEMVGPGLAMAVHDARLL